MAGLKRTQRSGARTGATDTYYSDDDYVRDDYSRGGYSRDDRQGTAHARSSVRPRFGTGARPAPARRRTSDGLLQWRLLALGACVLILGTGGVIAMRAMAPVAAPQAASLAPASPPASQPGPVLAAASAGAVPTAPASTASRPTVPLAPAPQAGAPLAAASAPATTPARASVVNPPAPQPAARVAPAGPNAAAGHAQMATQVASILGSGASAPVDPARAAPTAEDLARPAFLEPPESDEADLPEGAAEAAGDATPLPTPRPAGAKAESDADARTVRIRSAVTLRSGPRRSASAIGTLDEGTRVTLYSCKSWCEVSSGDKRGFIYKSAVAQ